MDVTQYNAMALEAKERRDARIASAIQEIFSAENEYKHLIEGLRRLKPLVGKSAPDLTPEPIEFSSFEGWVDLQNRHAAPTSGLDRIRKILPSNNETFGLKDLQQKFAEQFPDDPLSDGVWPVYFARLCNSGEIVRVRRQRGSTPGIYASAGYVGELEKETQPLADAAVTVLRSSKGWMSLAEIARKLIKVGAIQKAEAPRLKGNILKGLRRRIAFVEEQDGKWRAINPTEPAENRKEQG